MIGATDHGFALVETLTALAIAGLVFALFGSLIGMGREVQERVEFAESYVKELSVLNRVMSGTLSQVVVSGTGAVVGNNNRLHLRAIAPRALASAETVEVEFSTDESGRGLQAVWSDAGQSKGGAHRLIEVAVGVQLSYYRRDTGWVMEWPPQPGVPDLVSIRMEYLGAEHRRDELILAVRKLRPLICRPGQTNECLETQ